MFYVYMLQSLKDFRLYIEFTQNLKRRVAEHMNSQVKSTRHRAPLKLICYEAYSTKVEAQKREKFLKSSDGKKDIRRRLTITLKS